MLFSHYVVLLALLVGLVIGATLVYSQSLYIIRKPLKDSMTMYDPMSDQPDKVETTEAWDDIQQSVSLLTLARFNEKSNVIILLLFFSTGAVGFMVTLTGLEPTGPSSQSQMGSTMGHRQCPTLAVLVQTMMEAPGP